MSKFEELQQAPQTRIDQAINRKIRHYEDEALVAMQMGDTRLAMQHAATAEMLEKMQSPEVMAGLDAAGSMAMRRNRLRALMRSTGNPNLG